MRQLMKALATQLKRDRLTLSLGNLVEVKIPKGTPKGNGGKRTMLNTRNVTPPKAVARATVAGNTTVNNRTLNY